jgi:iron complex transport system permease protein
VQIQPRIDTDAPAEPRADSPVVRLRRWRGFGWFAIALGVVAGAMVLGAMVGPSGTSVWRVPLEFLDRIPGISIDSGVSDREWSIIWNIRMPRVVLAGIVGAMLAVGGTAYQGVFRNPLVDPYLLGAAAGAGLGATIVIAYRGSFSNTGWPIDPVPLVAFVFAIGTVAITYFVGASFGGARSTANLVLAGVAMVSLTTAIQTFILQRNSEVVRDVYSWILGRVNTASWADVRLVTPYVAVSCLVLFLHRRHLDLLRVGDEEAATLGVPVARVRLIVVVAATLGTAAVVAVSGLIGFVGLIVPHAVRLIAGSSYRRVLPLAAAFGAAFLILVDIPGRMLTAPAELPIGVVTAFFGAPFFILLLRARQVTR